MSVEEYFAELESRAGLTPVFATPNADGVVLMSDPNHTHFEIVHPETVPIAIRREVLGSQLVNLAIRALGY